MSTATAEISRQLDPGLAADELDGGGEGLHVAAAAGGVELGQHALVAADGAAHLGGGGLDAEDEHATSAPSPGHGPGRDRPAEGGGAGRPAPAPPTGCVRNRSSSSVARAHPHLQEVGRQGGGDHVAPLDDGDPAVVEQLADPEVVQLLDVVEAVDVEVQEGEAALVGAGQHERRGW